MAFPIVNAHVNSLDITSKPITTISQNAFLYTMTFGYPIMDVPAVVDVSGMEFGVAVRQDSASGVGPQSIASGASTIELVFGSLGTTGTGAGSGNHLVTGEDFSNTLAGGWTTSLWRKADGNTTASDLAAGDVIGLHVVANLTGAVGIGIPTVQVAYIYGAPGDIND